MGEEYPADEPEGHEHEPVADEGLRFGAAPEDELIRLEGVRQNRQRRSAEMRPIPVQTYERCECEPRTGDLP